MYAIISSGGKQYRVQEGDILRVEKLAGEPGDKVELEQVLFVQTEEGTRIGHPRVDNVRVLGTIVEVDKERKVLVFKKKKRKQYRRTRGHRQPFTAVQVDSITL